MNEKEVKTAESHDSLNIPLKKSPLFWFAMLQIPLVIFMVIMIYFLYQARSG